MAELQNTPGQEPEDQAPYTPASPAKRALAWMGVIYMGILVALITYNLATGAPLQGSPGILLAPACGCLAVLSLLQFRKLRRGGLLGLGIAAGIACAGSLILGISDLLQRSLGR